MLQAQFTSLLNANNFIPLPETDVITSEIDGSFTVPKQSTLLALIDQLHALIVDSQKDNADLKQVHHDTNMAYLKIASYCRAILLSPSLDDSYELTHVLKIWEIRILCLLFLTDPAFSKSPATHTVIPNAKFLRSEVNILMKELVKIEETRIKRENRVVDKRPAEMRLPEELDPFFKDLLRRVKYGPSLVLINYTYMDLFDLRGALSDAEDRTESEGLLKRIEILAYATAAAMIARRENLSVFNLLSGAIADAQRTTHKNTLFISRLSLLATLIGLIYLFREYSGSAKAVVATKLEDGDSVQAFAELCVNSPYWMRIKKLFAQVTEESPLEQLSNALRTVPPVYDDEKVGTSEVEPAELKSIEKLQFLVHDLKVTGRILCSLCAEFELVLRREYANLNFDDGRDGLDKALETLNRLWFNGNVSKVYGFE